MRTSTTSKNAFALEVYPLYSVYLIFRPELEYPLFSIVHLALLSSVHSFTDCGFVVAKLYTPAEPFEPLFGLLFSFNFHCKTNMTNKEKNIICLRSLTAVLKLLEKETAEERCFFLLHNTNKPSLTHTLIPSQPNTHSCQSSLS